MFRRSLTALAVAVGVAGSATIAAPAFAAYPASVPTVTSVSAPSAAYGAAATVSVAVSSGAGTPTGTATVKVSGRTASLALKSGKASYAVSGLAVGSYAVSVSYAPTSGSQWKASSASTTLKVVAAKTSTKVSAAGITVGSKATLKASVASNGAAPSGSVKFVVNGKGYTRTVSAGAAAVSVSGLPVGTYTVTATFTSSKASVLGSSAKTTLKVAAKKTSVSVTNVSVRKGHRPTVTAKPSVTGNVTLKVTGPNGYSSSRTVRITAGHSYTFSVAKSVTAAGKYSVKVSLNPSSDNYANSSKSVSVTVK
ncbi:Ig-like domain repeat protein [Cellulomonas alba]|uniref:Ig-like domain repeat protein n=1 Tax=Cellulomonas alba TaxID=3053467 RepID=A0ABT7SGY2_9CELL|nr:Ig-like domain repeat protein [Cellulomonas alba]MDM7855458.1 Ig-like domain repeat protein [Cellulomonas alba]